MFESPFNGMTNPNQPNHPEQLKTIEQRLAEDSLIEAVATDPKIASYMSVHFEMAEHDGKELKPGQQLGFVIPKEFRGRLVRDVILKHRKDSKHAVDIGTDRHDPYGAYSRVELHDTTSDTWVGWRDPKGYSADKFAEPRPVSDPENEVLHDWIATVGKVFPDAVRITNVGQHAEHSVVSVHGVEVIFHPDLAGVEFQERIYCPGTAFIDIEKNALLPKYGGGSATEGQYVGALALNQRGAALYELGTDPGPDARISSSRLELALTPGQQLAQVEVAVGDTEHLASVSQKTGRRTRLGYAKLWVGIQRAQTSTVDWFIQNANIPPQGVLAGGPHLDQATVEVGDTLVVESRDDAAYVMGWRLAYRKEQ